MEKLEGMHVDQQILHLLLIEHLAEGGHFAASQADDFAYPVVIGGQAAQGKVFFLEDAFEPGTVLATR